MKTEEDDLREIKKILMYSELLYSPTAFSGAVKLSFSSIANACLVVVRSGGRG